jgi:2-dehydro-3-deoxy-D-arabinonate dehydratase
MQLCKFRRPGTEGQDGEVMAGVLELGKVRPFRPGPNGPHTLTDVLHSDDPAGTARSRVGDETLPVSEVTLLAPVDRQEVWAAGVTYKRSKVAREAESAGAARFYDLVYTAPRPELFFKALAHRVAGPGGTVHVRRDSKWSIPEPEFTLVVSPKLQVVGYTIGNDMSSRDIEGENPLYLPQAKFYDNSCSIGPAITLAADLPPRDQVTIRLTISRGGAAVFEGSTTLAAMARTFEDLVSWLGRENTFPDGALLLTGTGVVPPDEFTLASGDRIAIDVTGIGRLENVVR